MSAVAQSQGEKGGKLMCSECEDVPAALVCEDCAGDAYCGLCFRYLHRRGARAKHKPRALPGVDMAQHLEPKHIAGTTEHFVETFRAKSEKLHATSAAAPSPSAAPASATRPRATSGSSESSDSSSDAESEPTDASATAKTKKSVEGAAAEMAKWVPVRLRDEERALLGILEGVLEVSEYTDHVDVSFDYFGWRTGGMDKQRIIDEQLTEVLHLICGVCIAGDYQRGKRILEKELQENEQFFQTVFEIGRRFKIMNPDKMRTTYGKLMHMLQDCVQSRSLAVRNVMPIMTVRKFLDVRAGLALLDDPTLERATMAIVAATPAEVATLSAEKTALQTALCSKHTGVGKLLTEAEVRLCLDSLSDANSYLVANRDPVDKMIALLKATFPARQPTEEDEKSTKGLLSLEIRYGMGGSCLNHTHEQQFEFVRQSLTLWREVQHNMFKLWLLADRDLLSSGGYRLVNTGQGLNRMQAAPNISAAMGSILGSVQGSLDRSWLGLSVVHLGDYDVPNALFFIDKYTQVPRILAPLVRAIERIDVLAKDPRVSQLIENCGGAEFSKRFILRDFFRHGFDGSGSDGGSCVDGRLTSAWNWCSQVEKKVYYPLLLATGFDGFDGSFR